MATLADRNNNPGNIRGNGGAFKSFDDPLDGIADMLNDLTSKMSGGSKHKITEGPNKGQPLTPDSSIYELISIWAPRADNNDPVNYVADVANKLGISPDTKLSDLKPHVEKVAYAMAQHEGYNKPWPGLNNAKIEKFNPEPFSSGEVEGGAPDDGLNIPGLTVDKKPENTTGPIGRLNPKTGKLLVPDTFSPDADAQSNEQNYQNVKNPITRGVRQTAHQLGENTVGIGKSLLNTGLGAVKVGAKAFNPASGAGVEGLINKIPKRITQPTNQAQSAGNIGGKIGQLLAPIDQASQAVGNSGMLQKIVSKVPIAKSVQKLAGVAPKVAEKAATGKTGTLIKMLAGMGLGSVVGKLTGSSAAKRAVEWINPFD